MLLRRTFLTLSFLLMPLYASAQAPARVGILVQEMGRAQNQAIKGLREELKRLGYSEGKELALETRSAKGNRGVLGAAADDLIRQKVRLIFATGTSATRAAATASAESPVVFVHPADPVVAGLIQSSQGRAGNLTGVAAYAGETTETRLAYFKEILPGLQKIIVFFDANSAGSRENFKRAENAAQKLNIETAPVSIKSADELRSTIANLQTETGAGIFHVADDLVESQTAFLFSKAREKKIPTMFNEESWAINGALAAYGPNYFEMGRKAASLAAKIISGEQAASLPIERADKFDLTLNYRTSRFIGVSFSPVLLKKANRVIR